MNCVICGKEFTSHIRNKITCSPECSRKNNRQKAKLYMRRRKQGDIAPSRPPRPFQPKPYECKNCGKTFTTSYLGEKFCSDECRFQFFGFEFY